MIYEFCSDFSGLLTPGIGRSSVSVYFLLGVIDLILKLKLASLCTPAGDLEDSYFKLISGCKKVFYC